MFMDDNAPCHQSQAVILGFLSVSKLLAGILYVGCLAAARYSVIDILCMMPYSCYIFCYNRYFMWDVLQLLDILLYRYFMWDVLQLLDILL